MKSEKISQKVDTLLRATPTPKILAMLEKLMSQLEK